MLPTEATMTERQPIAKFQKQQGVPFKGINLEKNMQN